MRDGATVRSFLLGCLLALARSPVTLTIAAGLAPLVGYARLDAASRSMLPTIRVGDAVMMAPFRGGSDDLHRGDIIAYESESVQDRYWIRRLVGLPGDFALSRFLLSLTPDVHVWSTEDGS